MKKSLFIILAIVLSANTVFGQMQSKKKVVVYVTDESKNPTYKILRDGIVEAFSKSSSYSAIETSEDYLKAIGEELKRSDFQPKEQRLNAVKQAGADLVCIVKISQISGQSYVRVNLVEAEASIVVKSAKATTMSLKSVNEAFKVAEIIVAQITGSNNYCNNYFAWGILDLGYNPYKISTYFSGRYGVLGVAGIGYHFGGGVEMLQNGSIAPVWSIGGKLYPYKNWFLSAGYSGTLIRESHEENLLAKTESKKQLVTNERLTFLFGHDFLLGDRFSDKAFFLSLSGGIARDLQTNQWSKMPVFELKIGAAWKLK